MNERFAEIESALNDTVRDACVAVGCSYGRTKPIFTDVLGLFVDKMDAQTDVDMFIVAVESSLRFAVEAVAIMDKLSSPVIPVDGIGRTACPDWWPEEWK